MAGRSGQLVGKMALSDYNPPHFQTRWLDIVGSWLEYEWRLVRLLEGPFVVLAQIRPLQSGYNIVMNDVHYIENSSGEYEQFCHTLTVAAVCHHLKDSLHCMKETV